MFAGREYRQWLHGVVDSKDVGAPAKRCVGYVQLAFFPNVWYNPEQGGAEAAGTVRIFPGRDKSRRQ